MTIFEVSNLMAGFYKGSMDAAGFEVDPAYMGYLVAGSSVITGFYRGISAARHNRLITGKKENKLDDILKNSATKLILGSQPFDIGPTKPIKESIRGASLRAIVSGIEIGIGYGIGYALLKIFD